MFKKLNYKVLLIILVVLIGIYLISEYSGSGERTFKSEVVGIDTARITRITIENPGNPKMVFSKTGPGWQMEAAGEKYPVQSSVIRGLLLPLAGMKSDGVAAIGEEKHGELQVNDSAAVHVVAEDDGKKLADLYIGRLSYQQPSAAVAPKAQSMQQYQQQGKMITYVREAGDETVYGVEGFLRSTFGRKPDDFRDKTLVKLNQEDITKVEFDYTDKESFILQKQENDWYVNGQKADSASTVKYLRKLRSQRGREFADDYNTAGSIPISTLSIEGNNFMPVVVKAYPADTIREYIITSTLNPDAKFAGAKGVYTRLFEEKDYFLK
ncbi:MAG: DUF4340 domain-containing protein [Bacteroidales bacterium]|nr:DUF4340 domain-containing protein [Bacteroidales bacterium]MCF8387273.1 DUF4340 domain-containing protein [Bacteroidales bacterium]MCF8396881.1 DUF4340 domain-containing protein [Bacteroidales bacterium]